MITAVRQHWQTPVALARERVVFTAKTKFCFARIGGKQGSRVVQGASKHAVFIVEHSASRKECALKFDTLLSGECQSCGAGVKPRRLCTVLAPIPLAALLLGAARTTPLAPKKARHKGAKK